MIQNKRQRSANFNSSSLREDLSLSRGTKSQINLPEYKKMLNNDSVDSSNEDSKSISEQRCLPIRRKLRLKKMKIDPLPIKKEKEPITPLNQQKLLENKLQSSQILETQSILSSESSHSSSCESCSEDEDLQSELKNKINELVFHKIELPSSSSNKSIINTLDAISALINKIHCDDFFEVFI
jgi:hypothetical protein